MFSTTPVDANDIDQIAPASWWKPGEFVIIKKRLRWRDQKILFNASGRMEDGKVQMKLGDSADAMLNAMIVDWYKLDKNGKSLRKSAEGIDDLEAEDAQYILGEINKRTNPEEPQKSAAEEQQATEDFLSPSATGTVELLLPSLPSTE